MTAGRTTSHDGIAVHGAVLDARDVTETRSIPVTSVARTLVDLAGVVPQDHLTKALKEAERLRTFDLAALQDVLRRTRTRRGPGHRAMREALAEYEALGAAITRSSLEEAFLGLVHAAGLPIPQTNVLIEGMEVDAVWPKQRLIAELDGYAYHRQRHAFERDRERDAALTAAGWRVVRFTHRQMASRPDHVHGVLRRLGLG